MLFSGLHLKGKDIQLVYKLPDGGDSVPTFDAMAASAGLALPSDPGFAPLSALDVTEITSEAIEDYLHDLYDNKGVRGAKFSRYRELITRVLEYVKGSGYITEIPQAELRAGSYVNRFNKPDGEALRRLLAQSGTMPISTIIRLSWECGLQRTEISALKYEQIDFELGEIVLPDRRVPLSAETLSYLWELMSENRTFSDYVLVSQKKTAPMAEPSISRLVRTELDKFGQDEVRLADLRFDYIVGQLRRNSIEFVSYISGVETRTLQAQYLPYADGSSAAEKRPAPSYDDFYCLMHDEGGSMSALALWFVWQLGYKVTELPRLKWDMVDLDGASMGGRGLPDELASLLRGVRAENERYSPYIFLTESTKKPLTRERITKMVKQTLVSSGIFDIGFKELCADYSPELEERRRQLAAFLAENGCADRSVIADALSVDERTVNQLLRRLRADGDIVLVGRQYYLRGAVVSPEEQHSAIMSYISEHPMSSRAELCDMLGLANRRQFLPIIKPLIDEGLVARTAGQRYILTADIAEPTPV